MRRIKHKGLTAILAAVMLLAAAGAAQAVVYNLRTGFVNVTMPDGRVVQMAGFGIHGQPITVPGPTLDVPAGDNLKINLTNNLPAPVSIVIPGLGLGSAPTPVMDGSGRVESFTTVAAAGGGQAVYNFACRPGTFLYESGADPALQVPMGLYGAVRVYSATPGQAYSDPSTAYDVEKVLVFSDVDPTLNDAVKAGTFGTPAYPSTVGYAPRYFLINGKAFRQGDIPVYLGPPNSKVLLRMVNAGSLTYNPTINGTHMRCIAEDGYLLPASEERIAPLLPAGGTKDALITVGSSGVVTLYDRRLYLANDNSRPGGMMAQLQVAAAAQTGPQNVSITAANGLSNVAQQVDANWGHQGGAAMLKNLQIQIGSAATGGIIKVRYLPATNLLYVLNDAGTAWLGGFAPGSANIISNSLGSLNCANSTVVAGGNNIRVSFNITPATGYVGNKVLYMYAVDNANVTTGFQLKGTWAIFAVVNVAPTNVSASAAAGNVGVPQQVNATWADGNGSADLKLTYLQVGTNGTGGILKFRYVAATNLLYLLNDAGTAWLGGFTPGSANSVSNSRVTLNYALTTVTPAGNNLTISFNLTPLAGYTGNKPLFLYAFDNANATTTAWSNLGTWAIGP